MTSSSYVITFACYNQVEYTRQYVDSLVRHGLDLSRVVAVDNASQDGTRDYLESLPLGGRIYNRQNLGCGIAWNQGALALQADWTIVMNNDVVVSAGWLDSLLGSAQASGFKVVSPAMIEGTLDYDFDGLATNAMQRMAKVFRPGAKHAVCMAIHRSVWEEVGYFRAMPRLWGFEDTLFFHELDKARIPTAMVGSSWVHHFGSITLSALKRERGLSQQKGLSARDSYKLLGQSFLERKWKKFTRLRQANGWRHAELAQFGMTLLADRADGSFNWR